jgi:hypothetical protein
VVLYLVFSQKTRTGGSLILKIVKKPKPSINFKNQNNRTTLVWSQWKKKLEV